MTLASSIACNKFKMKYAKHYIKKILFLLALYYFVAAYPIKVLDKY